MSDIPPHSISLPELPNELLLEIFYRCDASTILNGRMTSRYWRGKLNSYHFVTNVSETWRNDGISLMLHFFYPSSFMSSLDWVMMMDASTGYTSPFQFPFLLTYEGWFQLIGIQNGVFCIRYSSMGQKSYLIAWNPVSRRSKLIPDPVYIFEPEMAYSYAFSYYPYTFDYAIVYVFQHSDETTACTLTMYTSTTRTWDVVLPCPSYVQRLDPTYVTLDGVIYWLTRSFEDVEQRSPYIVCFSILSQTFQQIVVPEQALGHCYMLMNLNQKLCLTSSNHNEEDFSTAIWHVNVTEEKPTWTRLFMYNGDGPLFTPTNFIGEDIIQIKESHFQVDGVNESKFSHFHICRYTPMNNRRRTLHWVEYEDEVRLRSMHVYHKTLYPV